jgi:RHS repeat-associated protein
MLLPGSQLFYAHTDAMGNVRALANYSGQVKRTYNYDEWGGLQATSWDSLSVPNADRARWKGALWMGPELDLYYMRNRWYEPRTGRFLSEDPIGLEGGINPYAFAGSDPINGADPSGLMMDVPDNGGGPGCWSALCQAAWNPGDDWNGDGLGDLLEFSWYVNAVQTVRRNLHAVGDYSADPRVIVISILNAVRSMNWDAASSDWAQNHVLRMLADGRMTVGLILPNGGETYKGHGQIVLDRSLFPDRNAINGSIRPELSLFLAHELGHHFNDRLILFDIRTPAGRRELQRQEHSAECYAVRLTGIVLRSSVEIYGYYPGCR